MSDSLFRHTTRYSGSENRLTQVLVAVLERIPDLALELARLWTAPSNEAHGEVAYTATRSVHLALGGLALQAIHSQVRTVSGKQVDLTMRFGASPQPSAEDVVIWVENKVGADPHDQQLPGYVKDLPHEVREAAVVLLAPRASLPYEREVVPDGVPQRSWQAAGRCLHEASTHRSDPVELFLLKELIAFMREDNLTDPEAIGPELLVALAYADQAEAALVRICEEVSRYVAREYGEPNSFLEAPRTRKPGYGWGYWEAWTLREAKNGDATLWLDWNAQNDTTHRESDGRSLFFMSGLAAYSYVDLAPSSEDRLHHEQLQEGVKADGRSVRFQPVSDDCERLTRVAFPEEVLIGRTLEAQAASIGAWIIEGFRVLTAGAGVPTDV